MILGRYVALCMILFPIHVLAVILEQDALILTHTSRHYHTNSKTILKTQELIQNSKSEVIALVQNPLSLDDLWYGEPLSNITHEFYSHAGEHTLTFPEKEAKEFHLTAVGGYLSACLGRTLSTLVREFIRNSGELKTLTLHLPMNGIFTGFIKKDQELIPKTPYQESILDSSMDGLNLEEVLTLIPEEALEPFLQETIIISIYQKSTMMDVSQSEFDLEVLVKNQKMWRWGSESSGKKIILNFE